MESSDQRQTAQSTQSSNDYEIPIAEKYKLNAKKN